MWNTGEGDRAIADFTKAILLTPQDAEVYNNRGVAYGNIGESGRAIADFTKVIVLDPGHAGAYTNRGGMWLHLGEWEKATADFRTAKRMGVDIPAVFSFSYDSIEAFEVRHGAKVPRDLAALLSRD